MGRERVNVNIAQHSEFGSIPTARLEGPMLHASLGISTKCLDSLVGNNEPDYFGLFLSHPMSLISNTQKAQTVSK